MTPHPAADLDGTSPPGLSRMRALSRAVLWCERLGPALALPVGLVGLFVCVALLDGFRALPALVHWAVLIGVALGELALLVLGLRRIHRPAAFEVDRRLERDSGLAHQPLAVLGDTSSGGGDGVWAAHMARARAQLAQLRLAPPRPTLAAADQYALRALLLLGVFASAVIAGDDASARLEAAVSPGWMAAPAAAAVRVQAWITPPAYTGQPPLFLPPQGGRVSMPEGAKLVVSVTGGRAGDEPPRLQMGERSTALAALDASSFQIEQTLTESGRLAVLRQGREMAAWALTLVRDQPPEVAFSEPPGRENLGAAPQTRLPWQVAHDYGVTELHAELHLVDRPDAQAMQVAIPLPGVAVKSSKGVRIVDLTAHPWAGLLVTAELVAHDAPGLEGRSDRARFRLPARHFNNPLARAVIDIRRALTLAPDDRGRAIARLDEVSVQPGAWEDDMAGFLNLRAVTQLLRAGRDRAVVAPAQDRLWQLALHLEEGAADRTTRALEASQQKLHDALQAERKDDSPEQRALLERRLDELQSALAKRLEALAAQALRDPDSYDPDVHPKELRDMQNLADALRKDAQHGDAAAAAEKLAQLDALLQPLKGGKPTPAELTERDRKRAEQRKRGAAQTSVAQDMIQRESVLLDRAESRVGDRDSGMTPSDAASIDPSQADQRSQLALRRATGELMQEYGDLMGQIPPSLGEADAAMRQAAQALAHNNDAEAAMAAQRAIVALQQSSRAMQRQIAQQFGRGQQQDGDEGDEDGQGEGMAQGDGTGGPPGAGEGGQEGEGSHANRSGGQRDPFGRSRGERHGGGTAADDVAVPEQMEQAHARALQEELRRRGGERSRSQEELDYIDRLLKSF